MRKITFILIFSLLAANSLVAQKDSSLSNSNIFHKAIILKVNPGLMIPFLGVGEFGANVQFDITDRLAFFAGAGYNMAAIYDPPKATPPGYSLKPFSGFTIRMGAYYFFKKHRYISFQFFYRLWQNGTVYSYANGGTTFDRIEDPVSTVFGPGPDNADQSYSINTCSASVIDLSILYGRQILNRKQFFFEWYVGAGIRFKTINTDEFAEYDNQVQYIPIIPNNYISYQYTYPELKLGVQIGYKL